MHQVSKKHGTQGDNLLDRRLYRVGGREACGEPPNDVEGLELIRPSFVVTNLCVKLRDCAGEKFLVDVLLARRIATSRRRLMSGDENSFAKSTTETRLSMARISVMADSAVVGTMSGLWPICGPYSPATRSQAFVSS